MKQYMLTSPAYLTLKGSAAGTSPVFVDTDTKVGEGTAYDFEGPPSRAMKPLSDSAQEALDEVEAGYSGGPPTVKGTSGPAEGGASPFDPASDDTGSEAEKAKAEEQRQKDLEAKLRKEIEEKVRKESEDQRRQDQRQIEERLRKEYADKAAAEKKAADEKAAADKAKQSQSGNK